MAPKSQVTFPHTAYKHFYLGSQGVSAEASEEIQEAFEAECGSLDELMVGDTLAVFIAQELKETYEPDESDSNHLEIASNAIERATQEIEAVGSALSSALDQLIVCLR